MKYEFPTKETVLVGTAVHSAEGGENVPLYSRGFLRPETSDNFYPMLEALEKEYLQEFYKEKKATCNQVEHFLALISKSKIEVFVNEPQRIMHAIATEPLKAGAPVYRHQFAGYARIEFENLEIPQNIGFAHFFRSHWRMGLYIDFMPILDENHTLGRMEFLLAQCYNLVVFDDITSSDISVMQDLFTVGWFPFMPLIAHSLYLPLVSRKKENKPLTASEERIVLFFDENRLKSLVDSWKEGILFKDRFELIANGLERYLQQDWISCISIIYPQIDGILIELGPEKGKSYRPKTILDRTDSLLQSERPITLFPSLFGQYLDNFFYRNISLSTSNKEFSRHTIAHGLANKSAYTKKYALIGFLILAQINLYFSLNS